MESVAVVGGGVIGLSCAWRLAAAGHRVRLIDPAPARGASWVAGGMLAPLTESWPGEEAALDLGAAALERWPSFADELGFELRREGTLVLGVDSADTATLDVLADFLAARGREVDRLTGRAARALEPCLGPRVRSALSVPGDLAVDNRALLAALLRACDAVEFVAEQAVAVRPGRVEFAGHALDADVVVVTAGAHSRGLHPALTGVVRPVKGEILRLRARAGTLPPPSRTVRALVASRPVYLVPRADGELVLGATQHEVGYDTEVTAAGVRDLIADAEQVMPGIGEYALVETAAGLRAGSPDNVPVIGWLEPGVLAATGHHRNGLLLAPTTADAVVALVAGEPEPAATSPSRFAKGVR
ncbi:glycine oxidase ThiO [Actinokineospora fastidiosa]|uniref:glycine oxidase n=1 Tax=Actinokineospora fastidiosa TaxID=1816 RepID=A0A918G2J2_9PSEU|nr:glycine oxidase ThiO [Actinokineospora fastidiosa]GGS16049.1 glycine oxidase ThiO [Actinokineospora fastidiosa]